MRVSKVILPIKRFIMEHPIFLSNQISASIAFTMLTQSKEVSLFRQEPINRGITLSQKVAPNAQY